MCDKCKVLAHVGVTSSTSMQNCEQYCNAQSGLKCEKAWMPAGHSCQGGSPIGCGEATAKYAVCQCATAAQVKTISCAETEFALMGSEASTEPTSCVAECPPGYYEMVRGNGRKFCLRCLGVSRRRRAQTCTNCPSGEIEEINSDECQNIQDTCDKQQCQPCMDCMN